MCLVNLRTNPDQKSISSRSQSRATSPHRSPSGELTQGTAFPRLLDANLPPIVSVDETGIKLSFHSTINQLLIAPDTPLLVVP